jgi:hypothetical protein
MSCLVLWLNVLSCLMIVLSCLVLSCGLVAVLSCLVCLVLCVVMAFSCLVSAFLPRGQIVDKELALKLLEAAQLDAERYEPLSRTLRPFEILNIHV